MITLPARTSTSALSAFHLDLHHLRIFDQRQQGTPMIETVARIHVIAHARNRVVILVYVPVCFPLLLE